MRIGRLVEARVFQLLKLRDVDDYGEAVRQSALRAATGHRPVLCADHRFASVYPPEVADRLVSLFRQNNARFRPRTRPC
jgi:hypothetical protein